MSTSKGRRSTADFIELMDCRHFGDGGRFIGENVGRVAGYPTPESQIIVFAVLQSRMNRVHTSHQQYEGLVQFLHRTHQLCIKKKIKNRFI